MQSELEVQPTAVSKPTNKGKPSPDRDYFEEARMRRFRLWQRGGSVPEIAETEQVSETAVRQVVDVSHREISCSCPIRSSMDPVQHLAWRSVAPEEIKAAWTRSGVANDR